MQQIISDILHYSAFSLLTVYYQKVRIKQFALESVVYKLSLRAVKLQQMFALSASQRCCAKQVSGVLICECLCLIVCLSVANTKNC